MSVISTGKVAARNFFEASYIHFYIKAKYIYILRYACLVLRRERYPRLEG